MNNIKEILQLLSEIIWKWSGIIAVGTFLLMALGGTRATDAEIGFWVLLVSGGCFVIFCGISELLKSRESQ